MDPVLVRLREYDQPVWSQRRMELNEPTAKKLPEGAQETEVMANSEDFEA